MPRRRAGVTTSVTISGERFYLTANARADGSLGEVFLSWGKQGQTCAGLMDIYAVALSVGLQHGVPLLDLIHQGLDLYFVPNGHTDDPDMPCVRSVVDWIARRLAIDWLPYNVRAAEGIFTVDERVTAAGDWLAAETAKIPTVQAQVASTDPAAGPRRGHESLPRRPRPRHRNTNQVTTVTNDAADHNQRLTARSEKNWAYNPAFVAWMSGCIADRAWPTRR